TPRERTYLAGHAKIEAQHHLQVVGVAWTLPEQTGKVTKQLPGQVCLGLILGVAISQQCRGALRQAQQCMQLTFEVSFTLTLVFDEEAVLLPSLIEQRCHAMREQVEKRMSGIVTQLYVTIDQRLGIRPR